MLKTTKKQVADALDESKIYVKFLEKESVKKDNEANQNMAQYQGDRKSALLNTLAVTKSTVTGLESIQSRLDNLGSAPPDSVVNTIAKDAVFTYTADKI